MSSIILLGSYGRGNIGDDLFLVALKRLLREHKLTINSAYDELLPNNINADTIATLNNKDLMKKIRVFIKSKYIIYGGGDLWVELYGAKYPRAALWKMVIVNAASVLFGKKILYVGCGSGNISGFSLMLAKFSARLASKIVFRDEKSMRAIRNDINTCVLPDITLTLPLPPVRYDTSASVGIIPTYYIPNPKKNYHNYITAIADACNICLASNYSIKLISMLQDSNVYDDVKVCNDISKLINPKYLRKVEIIKDLNASNIYETINSLDRCISTRLHGVIVSTWLNKPVIGISYRPKITRFMESMNLKISIIDIDNLSMLKDKVKDILINKDDYASKRNEVIDLQIDTTKKYIQIFDNEVR